MNSCADDSLTAPLAAEGFAGGIDAVVPLIAPPSPTSGAAADAVDNPPADTLRVHGLAESMLVMLVLMVLQRGVGFVRGILFCRWLPAEQLGQWDLAYDFLLMAGPIAVLALPGCFGRYVEYYRSRGQLRSFVRRLSLASAVLTVVAVVSVVGAAPWFAELFFGDRTLVTLTLAWAATLAIVVLYNFCTELFMALRQSRLTAVMQFVNGLTFAAVSLIIIGLWNASAIAIVSSYAVACVVASSLALVWLRRTWQGLPAREEPLSTTGMWVKVLPFVMWVWISNWLTNLFGLADRYMIVHYSGLPSDVALQQVGEYHASRVVPLLLVTVAFMLGGILTPYLSHDWEAGRRREVSARTNLALKLSSLGLLAGGLAILLISGPLFNIAFENKYALGQAVLPMTLCYCCWFGLTTVVQAYLWCAERARQGSLALLAGLVVNVSLNLVWLPIYGLWGAVLATLIGNSLALLLAYSFALIDGLEFDPGTALLLAAPAAFALGIWPTAVAAVAVIVALACGKLLNRDEQTELVEFVRQYLARLPIGRRSSRPNSN